MVTNRAQAQSPVWIQSTSIYSRRFVNKPVSLGRPTSPRNLCTDQGPRLEAVIMSNLFVHGVVIRSTSMTETMLGLPLRECRPLYRNNP